MKPPPLKPDISKTKVGVVLLAGGSSSRMGQVKQLLPFRKTTIIGTVLNELHAAAFGNIIVVTGAHHQAIQDELPKSIPTVFNKNWVEGMATSISTGIHHFIKKQTPVEACLVMLSDQPLINANHLEQLFYSFCTQRADVAATSYSGSPGVPALFSSRMFKDLLKLKGDKGARFFLQNKDLNLVTVEPQCELLDIDHLDNYNQLKSFE